MVEIRCLVVGVKNAILQDVLCPFGQHAAHHRNLALGAVRHPIVGHTHAVLIRSQKIVCLRGRLAVLIPGTFDLRSADVAAPQKILRKCHIIYRFCFSKHTVCMDGFKDSGLKCTVCFAGCIGKGIAGKKKVKEL